MCVICDPSGNSGYRPCERCAQWRKWSDYIVAGLESLDSRLKSLEGAAPDDLLTVQETTYSVLTLPDGIHERHLYLPMVGLSLALGSLWDSQ